MEISNKVCYNLLSSTTGKKQKKGKKGSSASKTEKCNINDEVTRRTPLPIHLAADQWSLACFQCLCYTDMGMLQYGIAFG